MELLAKIEKFLSRHPMSESTFGRLAVSDARFIHELRGGRQSRSETVLRVMDFMLEVQSGASLREIEEDRAPKRDYNKRNETGVKGDPVAGNDAAYRKGMAAMSRALLKRIAQTGKAHGPLDWKMQTRMLEML